MKLCSQIKILEATISNILMSYIYLFASQTYYCYIQHTKYYNCYEVNPMSRRVFVSYSHAIDGFIVNLLKELADADFEVWTDKKIQEGSDWVSSIDAALQGSFAVIVILTPEAMLSPYVTYEWSMAIGLGLKILPVHLVETPKIHPKLEKIQYLDFRNFNHKWENLKKRLNDLRLEFINTPRAISVTLALLNEARLEYQSNNLGAALQTLQHAEEHANDKLLDNIYYEMALVHARLGDEIQAEACLQNALRHNAKHIQSLVILGSIHRRQADKAESVNRREELLSDSETRFRQALDIQPSILDGDGESVWGSLGGVLKRRGRIAEAIDAYKKATQVKKSSYPYNNLGLLYLEQRDMKQMQQNFKLVELFTTTKLLLDPSNEWVHNDYFLAKVILENTKAAEEALSTLLIIAPDYALQSLRRTLESIKVVDDFTSEVKLYIDYAIARIDERLVELSEPIEV
jgi:tetratricopeptide (TPR) repeat protein